MKQNGSCHIAFRRILWLLLFNLVVAGGRTLSAQVAPPETKDIEVSESVPVQAGIYVDLGYGYYHHSLTVFPGSADCGTFSEGNAQRMLFGPEFSLPSFFSRSVGLSGRLLLGVSETYLAASAEPFSIATAGGDFVQFDHEYRLAERALAGRLELLASFGLMDWLRLRVGGGLSYTVDRTANQTDYITDNFYRFTNGLRERQMPRADLISSGWGAGGILSLGTVLPISSSLTFAPQISVRAESYAVSDLIGNSGVVGSIGFSLQTDVGKSPRQPALPAVPLFAAIDLSILPSAENQSSDSTIYVVDILRGGKGAEWEIERKIYPPTLLLDPKWGSSEGIEKWEIIFAYGEEEIGRTSSESAENLSELNWKIANDRTGDTTQPLVVQLIVSDSSGAIMEVSDQVGLGVQRSVRLVYQDGEETIRTDFSSSEHLPNQAERDLLQEILEEAERGDRIVLQPRIISGTEVPMTTIGEMYQLATELQTLVKERGQAFRVDVLPDPEVLVNPDLYNNLPGGRLLDNQIEIILQKR